MQLYFLPTIYFFFFFSFSFLLSFFLLINGVKLYSIYLLFNVLLVSMLFCDTNINGLIWGRVLCFGSAV